MTTGNLVPLLTALAVLVTVAAGLGRWAGLGQARAVLTAALRAVIQLVAVGAVIVVVLRTPTLAPLYLLVMVVAATWTSARRMRGVPLALPAAGLSIVAGAAVSSVTVFACRALPFEAGTVVPLVAQLVGGAMTATTLAGQRLVDDVEGHRAEVDAWLALGATSTQAVRELSRRSAARALVPAIDQTRNVGLVVLPGAFVGLLLGGAGPVEAARIQLLVLIGLLAAQTVAAVGVTRILSIRIAGRSSS